MGFTNAQARKALIETSNNVERAVEWLFSHPDDSGDVEMAPANADTAALPSHVPGSSTYRVKGLISHRGTSVHCGHYVAHINEHDNAWVLFNDEKVVAMNLAQVNEMVAKDLYVAIFENIQQQGH